jgi:hypothetical protein
MLFDLYLDPVERINLIDDPRFAEVCQDLRNRLDQWMKSTRDPLLEGKAAKPAGARIHKRHCISNSEKDFE